LHLRVVRVFRALRAQNETMAARLSALESHKQAIGAASAADGDQADGTAAQQHLTQRIAELEAAKAGQEQVMCAVTTEKAALDQRVRELESDAAVTATLGSYCFGATWLGAAGQ